MISLLRSILFLIFAANCFAASPAFIGTCNDGAAPAGGCANSCSGVYGNQWTDGTAFTLTLNHVVVTKVSLAGACDGESFTVGVGLYDNNLGTAFTAKMVIYDDDGGSGEPGTRLFLSASNFTIDDTTIKTFTEAISSIGCISGDIYVGVVITGTAGGGAYTQYKGSGITRYYDVSGAAPATWDTGADTESTSGRPFYVQF